MKRQEFLKSNHCPSYIEKIINLGNTWIIRVETLKAKNSERLIHWNLYPISDDQVFLIKKLLISWWSPEVVFEKRALNKTDFRKGYVLIKIISLVKRRYKNIAISDLDQDKWIKIAIDTLYYTWKGTANKKYKYIDKINDVYVLEKHNKPFSSSSLVRVTNVLKKFHESYLRGEISDGPERLVSRRMVVKEMRQILGGEAETWIEGGTHGSIPFVISNLLLADALVILNSERTEQLLAYFQTFRELNDPELINYFWATNGVLRKYRDFGDVNILINGKKTSQIYPEVIKVRTKLAPSLHKKFKTISEKYNSKFIFPWKVYLDFLTDYYELQMAIYIIFLSVMGKRGPSEVLTLRGLDVTTSNISADQNALMRPSIHKTHKGLRLEQGVTNYIDQAFNVIVKLGYIDKTNSEQFLFTALPPKIDVLRKLSPLSNHTMGKYLDDYYDNFCTRVDDRVDINIKDQHEHIVSHQFRHTFAEFALRRFDGNVEELIRQHFCHSQNSFMTKRYTADKLDEEAERRINRLYIRELVPRVLRESDIDQQYVGAMALYIKKEFSKIINVLSAKEIEAHIESFCDDFVQITPHEYGWCLLHKKFENVAQCADSSGKPSPTSTSSDKCNRCANFVSDRNSHLEIQTQIAISHCDFLEQEIWSMPSFKKSSADAVAMAVNLFPELSYLVNK